MEADQPASLSHTTPLLYLSFSQHASGKSEPNPRRSKTFWAGAVYEFPAHSEGTTQTCGRRRARHETKTNLNGSRDAGELNVWKTSLRIRIRGQAISQINLNPDARHARGEITSRSRRGDAGEAWMSSVQRRHIIVSHSPNLIYFLLHYMRSGLLSLDWNITRVLL